MNNVYNNPSNNPKLTRFQMLQEARQDLVGEIDAIIQYDNHVNSADDMIAKTTWQNIRDEEMVHVGELLGLINYLDPSQKQFVENGLNEFNERLISLAKFNR